MSKEVAMTEYHASGTGSEDIHEAESVERVNVATKRNTGSSESARIGSSSGQRHGAVELVGESPDGQQPLQTTEAELERKHGGRFGYLKRRQFWIVLLLSQMLAISITGTSTITSLLNKRFVSIPAFQSLFNYVLLAVIYTSITLYKYGLKGWLRLIYKDGWRYFILAFFDVQGNYFTVLAYKYTNLLSAQLFNFWAITVVVAISFIFLKVRYHIAQYAGILICCAGLGLLIASDRIRHLNDYKASDPVKGDLFALLGATFYGLTNVFEEFLVSKRPMYEVIGQLGFWGMFINGVQAAIFDRHTIATVHWDHTIISYIVGYTLILAWFYSAAPIVFRMASAAFFNIGLLTGNFWGVIIGIKVLQLSVHWLYPIAFVLIMFGHFVYYGTEGVLGEAKKPWLGENQEGGADGIGTARRQLQNPDAVV